VIAAMVSDSIPVPDSSCTAWFTVPVSIANVTDPVFGPSVVGVLLTGANGDGAVGLQRIRSSGGYAIVQDPATAVGRAMPEAGIASGPIDEVVPLERISSRLVQLLSSKRATRSGDRRR